MENTEMWNKCPRENDLLKCIVVTHGCTGQTSILKVGETTILGHNAEPILILSEYMYSLYVTSS
jgi:hypothetical protein